VPIALFDLDNTLLDREGAFARWARGFAEFHGLAEEAPAYLVSADEDGIRPRIDLFADVRATFGLTASVDELVERYGYDYPAAYTFPDSSRAALRRLRSAGWKVAIVTNGPRFQERKLEVTGLDDDVDAVCVSAVVGSWKPDPGIFEEAARRCGVGLDGWMVGDSGPADIRGGQAVGLRTIWFPRGRTWDLGGPPPNARADSVVQATEIILGGSTSD
jgi:FMN phosphatase YigB (HAD superfamily)